MDRLNENVWRYQDETEATSYLVVGSERALMIDCGTGLSPVMPHIRAVTDKPVSLVLTHGHPDHYGASGEFDEIWIHEDDLDIAAYFSEEYKALPAPPVPVERIRTFGNGKIFGLGDRSVRAITLPGHTPGSVLLADPEDRMLFTGDAIGSGYIVLMSIVKALPLEDYLASLKAFAGNMEEYGQYTWHGGHYTQAGVPGTPGYNPLGPQTIRDMISLCEGILKGDIAGEEVPEGNSPTGMARRAFLGTAGIIW